MIKYYYMIPKNDLVYDMVRYSLMTLEMNNTPSRGEVRTHREKMRMVKDIVIPETPVEYFIVKMGLDFSTPFVGLQACTEVEMKNILKNTTDYTWEHNQ